MSDPTQFEIGEQIGVGYQVCGRLPARGNAQCYAAADLALGRPVTLQVCEEASGDALLREAKALAAVRHSSLPAVYGTGAHRGLRYLVMEPLAGTSLAEHIAVRRRASSWFHLLDVVPVLSGVAEALAAIHGAGRAHGDLRASNVLITEDERVLVLGFGSIDLGDAAADTRAFGQIAFEMFIGEPPRAGEDDVAALRPDVSTTLSDLIAMCFGEAADRPPMEVIVDELRAVPRRRARRRSTINGPYRVASR